MRAWTTLFLLSVSVCGCARAQSPIEIADGRASAVDEPADVTGWDTRPAVQRALADARAHWREQDPTLEDNSRVLDVAEGAFTAPGAEQQAVLYLVTLWPRCCPKVGLAILEGDRLVRNVTFEGIAQSVASVPDLDGDGQDEIVFEGEFGMGGQNSGSMTLAAFGPDGLIDWGTEGIYDSACATGRPSTSTASRILAHPGPTFTVEHYTQASCETDTWAPDGDPASLTLTAPEVSSYVDLPVR